MAFKLDEIKNTGPTMAGRGPEEVRVVLSPHRICPLGAHIDHQGGTVSAMTINEGILLGFIHSVDTEVKGPVPFSHSLMNQRGVDWGLSKLIENEYLGLKNAYWINRQYGAFKPRLPYTREMQGNDRIHALKLGRLPTLSIISESRNKCRNWFISRRVKAGL